MKNQADFSGRKTPLVHLQRDGKHLIFHRTKKDRDENGDKWLGVGGKFEPFQPPEGMVSRVKAPLSTDGNWKVGMKSGSADVQCVLGLCARGDCSTTAAANGGLKRVDYVDYSYGNIIGIWQKATVKAYGEWK